MIRELFRFSPLPVGTEAPALSLTADEGTWIKLRDLAGRQNAVLLFLRCVAKDEIQRQLVALNALVDPLAELDTRIFGINASRPDTLRTQREKMDLDFPFLYDPFAFTARAFGAAGRMAPKCRTVAFLVGKDQVIAMAQEGVPDPEALMAAVRTLEEVTEEADAPATPTDEPVRAKAPGEAQESVTDIDSPTAVQMLAEEASLYVLVDVRTKSEYDADHSPIAIHIPVDEITHRYHELGQTDHLIFVCQAGGRSAAAGEFMTSIGSREIYSVTGGMSSWEGDRLQTPNI
jgi:rhodanese-related sulfurtransferase/peroxiredoxin